MSSLGYSKSHCTLNHTYGDHISVEEILEDVDGRSKVADSQGDIVESQAEHPAVATEQDRLDTNGNRPPFGSENSASFFHGASGFVLNGGQFNIVGANCISESSAMNGIIKKSRVLSAEDISREREIYKGSGFRLYSGQTSGKIVAIKLYQGSRAKERCIKAAIFNQRTMHPNLPHMLGVSPLNSELRFIVFDGDYEGVVDSMIASALTKDLNQSLTLGLKTVIGLSSGLDYLDDLNYPVESVGLDHFLLLSCRGRVVVSFDPEELSGSVQRSGSHNSDGVLNVFHQLCQKTFYSACKAHYKSIKRAYLDDFDEDYDESKEMEDSRHLPNETESGMESTRSGLKLPKSNSRSSGHRRELVWKFPTAETATLNDISRQFQDLLDSQRSFSEPLLNRRRGRCAAGTAHRCPGYRRTEITLSTDISHSAIISFSTPTPHEICPVCKQVVKAAEILNCVCGVNDEWKPTVQCTSCYEWHHRPCVNFDNLSFICLRCVTQNDQHEETTMRNKLLNPHTSSVQSQSQGGSSVYSTKKSQGDSENNLRKARDALNSNLGAMRLSELPEAKREVVTVHRSIVGEKRYLEQHLDEERKAKERARQQLDSRIEELQRRRWGEPSEAKRDISKSNRTHMLSGNAPKTRYAPQIRFRYVLGEVMY